MKPDGKRPAAANEKDSIGYLARYAYRAFARALTVKLAPHGILAGQWSVLRVLWEREGPSQVELADLMQVEKASLTATLESMVRQRLIVRTRNAEDRRKVNIRLTAKGRALKARLLPYARDINRQAAKGMSAAEVKTLKTLLLRVTTNLDS